MPKSRSSPSLPKWPALVVIAGIAAVAGLAFGVYVQQKGGSSATSDLRATLLSPAPPISPIAVTDPWIREAPPMSKVLAGYMVLTNKTATPRILTGATSPRFGSVMLHRTVIGDGVARMVHAGRLEIPANGQLVIEPGGLHLMLMRPKAPLRAGERVELTLRFADGCTVLVSAEVRRTNP